VGALLAQESPAPDAPNPRTSAKCSQIVLDSGISEHARPSFVTFERRADVRSAGYADLPLGESRKSSQMLAQAERQNAGYALRIHALSPWARHVVF